VLARKRYISDDLFDFDIADQLHHDLVVGRLTVSHSTEVSGDLEKGACFGGVPKIASNRLFLQPR
jgi:hypothetical protein